MDRKTTRALILIITYIAFMVLLLVNFHYLMGWAQRLLGSLTPLLVGFAIAFVLNRPCVFLRNGYSKVLKGRGNVLSMPLAVLTSYVGLLVLISALFYFVLPKVVESVQLFVGSLSGYVQNLQGLINELALNFDQEALDLTWLTTYLRQLLEGALAGLKEAATQVVHWTSGLFSAIVTMTLSVVFSIYMLAGRDKLLGQGRRLLYAYVPDRRAQKVSKVLKLTAETFTNYVSGQLIEACILGGLCAAGMLFIQADYAPLIGVIIGVSALIPVAGAYIGAVLSAFLLVMVSPVRALAFLIFLVVLQQVEGNLIYPRVVGTSIGLPGIWVLTAVTVGGGLFGLPGILLSVPTASVLYTLLKRDVARRMEEEQKPSAQA